VVAVVAGHCASTGAILDRAGDLSAVAATMNEYPLIDWPGVVTKDHLDLRPIGFKDGVFSDPRSTAIGERFRHLDGRITSSHPSSISACDRWRPASTPDSPRSSTDSTTGSTALISGAGFVLAVASVR